MNRITFLSIIILATSFSVKAQEKYFFKVDKKDSDLRIQVPVRNYFYISKIIDERSGDTSRIGFVYKRFSSNLKQMEATFQDGLVPSINNFIEMSGLNEKSKDMQQPFYLAIKELEISESIGQFKSTGRVDLTVTFLKQQNDSLVSVFTAEVFEQAGMGSINSNLTKTKKCLEKALNKFEDFLTDKNQPDFYSDIAKETQEEVEKYGLKVQSYPQNNSENISVKIPRKYGIYKSFGSFIKNQPEITGNFIVEYEGIDKPILNIYSSTRTKLKGNYFCLYDGNTLYMSSQKFSGYRYFVKTSTIGNITAWKDRTIKSRVRQANYTAIGAGLGGIAGGVLASSIASSVGLDCVVLDTRTGIATIMDSKYLETLLKDDADLLKLYQTAPNPNDGEVLLYYIKEYNKKHPLL